jgi:hypothetical protein
VFEILGYHGSEYEDNGRLGYGADCSHGFRRTSIFGCFAVQAIVLDKNTGKLLQI